MAQETSIYFDPHLGASLDMLFKVFLCKKAEKRRKSNKIAAKFCKKPFFKLAPGHWLKVLFPEKQSAGFSLLLKEEDFHT